LTQIDEQKIEIENLGEKDKKIMELEEQLQYLENSMKIDTVKKSKYEKLRVLVEKKDEIITEKEKAIFEVDNSLNQANQMINELQGQLETFSLVKKDMVTKEQRIKSLVTEIEEKIQKDIADQELIKRLESSLEKAQKSSAKFEIQSNTNVELLKEKEKELKNVANRIKELDDKLYEAEKIEDKLLNDLTKGKEKNLKNESELEKKDKELVDLKKKIKIMRRDLSKS
jgi:chromosome segregation ATPase